MKHEKFATGLLAFFMAVFIALSGTACLATGFSLNVESWATICLWCIFFTLIAMAFFHFKWGALVFAALSLVALNTLLRTTALMDSVASVVTHITKLYDSGYHWGYLQWGDVAVSDVASDGFLYLLCSLVSACIAWTLLKKLPLVFAVLAGLFPMVLCCILRNTSPSPVSMWLLMSGIALLILSRSTCRLDGKRAVTLTARLLIPVMLFTSLVFIWAPTVSYEATSRAILEYITQHFQQAERPAPTVTGPPMAGTEFTPYKADPLDLSQAGPINLGKSQVMRVNTQFSGTLYLRDQAYDTYTGTDWLITADSKNEGGWPMVNNTEGNVTKLSISTMLKKEYRYIPYYINNKVWTFDLENGVLQNPDGLQNYHFSIQTFTGAVTFIPLSAEEERLYTALPRETQVAAQAYLSTLFSDDVVYTVAEQANLIAEFVKNSATYSKNTQKMPADRQDFALWFLESSQTGYCVHFATAATVLLRAAGIPARYVSGYMTTLSSLGSATVTADQAHAWVEYLDPGKGWTVLEATPAEPIQVPTEPTVPAPTEPTQPSEPDPTEPSMPTEPSAPPPTHDPSGGAENPIVPTAPMDWTWLIVSLQILLLWGILLGQHRLRKHLRSQWLCHGTANEQAVRRWKYLRRLSRLAGYHVPMELYYLTEKAVYSQHLLTDEELSMYDVSINEALIKLTRKKKPIGFLWKLLLAL